MKNLFIALLFLFQSTKAQTIEDCRQRYQRYLKFNSGLDQRVRFGEKNIHILNTSGKTELTIYESELNFLSEFLMNSSYEEQLLFWKKKGNKELAGSEMTLKYRKPAKIQNKDSLTLKGFRIAIDPGHFATGLQEAAAEQKYLYFKAGRSDFPYDSVKIFESALTYNTAMLIRKQLQALGAEVMITRDAANHTSFDCSYTHWIQKHRKNSLDSLVACGKLSATSRNRLINSGKYELFWKFFRDYDLQHRAVKINNFKPDLCLIVHYNVDEKNQPWTSFSNKNFTMAFIGGAFSGSNLNTTEMKINFLRLLIGDQLERSAELSGLTVHQFNQKLGIPVATVNDADYLAEKSKFTKVSGVFSRNLLLCRQVNSVLVYGEALYQDNAQEAKELMKTDINFKEIQSNSRLLAVSQAYVEAVKQYLLK